MQQILQGRRLAEVTGTPAASRRWSFRISIHAGPSVSSAEFTCAAPRRVL